MKKTVWHSGPPPEIGWWPASLFEDQSTIRWWDGARWSQSANPAYTAELAAEMAKFECRWPEEVKWTKRWWLK